MAVTMPVLLLLSVSMLLKVFSLLGLMRNQRQVDLEEWKVVCDVIYWQQHILWTRQCCAYSVTQGYVIGQVMRAFSPQMHRLQ